MGVTAAGGPPDGLACWVSCHRYRWPRCLFVGASIVEPLTVVTELLAGGFKSRTVEAVDGRPTMALRANGYSCRELKGIGFSPPGASAAGIFGDVAGARETTMVGGGPVA